MSDASATVAVVGGGVIGTSVLFHLAERGCTDAVLFERDQLAAGTTSKAAGGVRHVFANPFNVELGKKNIAFFEGFEDEVGRDVDFRQTGYMYLLHDEDEVGTWRDRMRLYDEHGVDARLLDPGEAAEVFPRLDPGGIHAAMYAPECGHVDPSQVTHAYAGAARDRGAEIHTGTAVSEVVVEDGAVSEVVTDGGTWAVDHIVDAAGPWAGRLAAGVGVDLPVELMGRRIAVTSPVDAAESPLIIDNRLNCYFRAETDGSILVCDMDQDVHDLSGPEALSAGDIGYDYYLGAVEKLERLVPDAGDLGIINGWAGIQTHTPDKSPIVDETGVDGFWVACGFSGHGVQKSPTVGAALADVILSGDTDVFDFDHFRLDRFDGGAAPEAEEMNM